MDDEEKVAAKPYTLRELRSLFRGLVKELREERKIWDTRAGVQNPPEFIEVRREVEAQFPTLDPKQPPSGESFPGTGTERLIIPPPR